MASSSDPLSSTVRWLAAHAGFPARRLAPKAEALLCLSALAAAEEAAALAGQRHLIQSKDGAKESAARTYAYNRKKVHYVCDNSAKV